MELTYESKGVFDKPFNWLRTRSEIFNQSVCFGASSLYSVGTFHLIRSSSQNHRTGSSSSFAPFARSLSDASSHLRLWPSSIGGKIISVGKERRYYSCNYISNLSWTDSCRLKMIGSCMLKLLDIPIILANT